MWLVVGLGNPGAKYEKTRHNIGFMVLDALAGQLGLSFRERKDYRICSGSLEDEKIILIEPLTFMNRSGSSVRKIADRHAVPPERIIIVHDDLDLAAGRLKIRKKGSSGGHKGVESVIQHIGDRNFIRVKIGIGRDPRLPAEIFVLSRFPKDEAPVMQNALVEALDAITCIIKDGPDKAMNQYNS